MLYFVPLKFYSFNLTALSSSFFQYFNTSFIVEKRSERSVIVTLLFVTFTQPGRLRRFIFIYIS